MKLKEFNPLNSKYSTGLSQRFTPAAVHMGANGVISLNRTAWQLMGIAEKDQVILVQDEDEPESWYFEKVSKDGFTIRSNGKGTIRMQFNSKAIINLVFTSIGYSGKGGRMLIAGQPTILGKRILWGILTSTITTLK